MTTVYHNLNPAFFVWLLPVCRDHLSHHLNNRPMLHNAYMHISTQGQNYKIDPACIRHFRYTSWSFRLPSFSLFFAFLLLVLLFLLHSLLDNIQYKFFLVLNRPKLQRDQEEPASQDWPWWSVKAVLLLICCAYCLCSCFLMLPWPPPSHHHHSWTRHERIMRDISSLVSTSNSTMAISLTKSWNTSSNPCLWSGVICSSSHGLNSSASAVVTRLSLSGFGLSNTTILASICPLDTLQSLDLSKKLLRRFARPVLSVPHEGRIESTESQQQQVGWSA